MSNLDTIIGTLPGTQLSLGGLLTRLRMQGRLGPLVLDALTEQLVEDAARQAGLSVTREELQSAADAFRRQRGLNRAAETHAWLSGRGMTVDNLQANLEHDLLGAKLRQHLTAGRIERHFTAHQTGYERLRLAALTVGRDDLANELASQVRNEGCDLDALAREHRVRLARSESFRNNLAAPLAEALSSAGPGQLVGPLGTPKGFMLVLMEERRPPALDAATRQHIEDELFTAWLAERTRAAKIDLTLAGMS